MKKALIIIDIQNDYFEGGNKVLAGSLEASWNAKILLEKFRKDNLPIIHIQHVSTREGSTFFLPNTSGVEFHSNVQPLQNEDIIVKHYPNGFRETSLLEVLKTKGITELVVCGMMTHMCVDATTRAAKDFGFNCTVIEDACATLDQEINGYKIEAKNVHYSFMAALNFFYASVISTQHYMGN